MTTGRQSSGARRKPHVGIGQALRAKAAATIVAGLAVVVFVSGCTTDSGTGTTKKPAVRAKTSKAVFGDTVTWENGLQVKVGQPSPFTPSESAAFHVAPSYLAFDVTIVNGTDENWDPRLFSTTVRSGKQEASEVFDSTQGLEGPPSTNISVGEKTVFKIGYGVSDPHDLVMHVSPGFLTVHRTGDVLVGQDEIETVIFTN